MARHGLAVSRRVVIVKCDILFVDIEIFLCPDIEKLNGSVVQEFMKIVSDLTESKRFLYEIKIDLSEYE